jgi:V-type H+-transporting ATPase subunit H
MAANGVGKQDVVQEPLQALVSWIASQLQSSSAILGLVTPSLLLLLTESVDARHFFISAGGIGYLTKHLRQATSTLSSSTSPTTPSASSAQQSPRSPTSMGSFKKTEATVQQRYELCFCLWTLTYECHTFDLAKSHFSHGAIAALVDLVTAAPREKVVRVALSALRNLATTPVMTDGETLSTSLSSKFLNEMIGCGLLKSIDIMKQRQWTDPDILEGTSSRCLSVVEEASLTQIIISACQIFKDMDVLHRLLRDNYKEMSRWDVYLAEVETGHLEWSAVHTEKFFKQNAKRMEGPNEDFSIVKVSEIRAFSARLIVAMMASC